MNAWMRTGWLPLLILTAATASAASSRASTRILVQVRPEVLLSREGPEALRLTIRLSPGAQATLWLSDSCGVPGADTYKVSQSGRHEVPLSSLNWRGERNACLTSSDGSLRTSLPLADGKP